MKLTDEHRQVLEASFLCRLSPADRETLLSLAEYREVGGRENGVKDDTMALLLHGEADVAMSADSVPRRGGPVRLSERVHLRQRQCPPGLRDACVRTPTVDVVEKELFGRRHGAP